ncbi:MAG TPA: hypothetical protein PKW42_05680, partial [bacterium]|nr:hypothetical protein [bacterium]
DVTFTDVDLTDSVSFDTDTLNTFFSLAVYRDDSPVDNGWFSALDNNVATTLSAWTSPAPGVYTATCTLTRPEDLPADDTGASAGADYYLALKTTAALPYGLRFAVGVSNFIIATNDVDAPYTPAGTTTTNTIVAEAAINDLVSVTGFDYSIPEEMSEPGKNYLMLADNADLITRYRYQHYLTDDNLDGETANLTKFTSRPMVLPIDTPTALLGIDAAGNAGVQKALATYQELVVNSVTVTFKDTSGGRFDPKTTLTALNAVNPGQSGVAIYADTNNNGIFDAAVDTAVPVDATRGTNGFTWGTDGDDNTTLTIYLDATAANAALPATSDGRSDFFVVVRVSQNNVPYGASFKTFIKQGDISFVQVPQAAKEALSIAESKVAAAPLVFALSDITARYIDPRSSNIPIIGVNLAFGTNSTETLDYIKVTLSGDGLSASDFLPISGGTPPAGAVVPSGLMLYRDNKAAGLVGSFDASDIFVPIHSHSWVYENGKLTGIVQPETAIAVSGNVLANDTGANRGDDYFIILRTSSTLKYQDKIQVSVGATDVSISGHASAAGGLNSDADREKDGSQPIVANVTTLLSDLTRAGQRMNPSGAPTAVMKFTAYSSDETGVETVYLQSVVVHLIPGTGFNLSDLAFFTRDKNSGLALYADSNKNGVFDEEDQLVVPVVAPSSLSRSDEPYYRFLIQPENPPQVSTTGSTFFVVLRASASMEDSDTFQVRIHGSNIEPLRSYGVGYGTKVAADPTSKLYQEAVVASAGPEPEKLTLTAALNDTGNDFTQDWYLLVKSGAAAGKVYRIVSVDHTRTVVTCAGANFVTAGVAGGDQVRVLKVNGFSFAKLSTNVISGNPYFSPLVLTDLIGPNGTGVDATSDPVAAIGISVCDLAANTTLNSLRVYFNPLAPAGSLPTPGQALASISSTRSSGLSLWRDNGDGIFNPATDTLVPVTSSGWQSDSSGYITGQVAPEGSRLSLFAASDKVSWYDQDAN